MACGTCRLQQLQKLSLQSNRLTAIDQLAACTMLEELWLSHNGITSLQVLSGILKVLDHCAISRIILGGG